jgi:hypothetical protein
MANLTDLFINIMATGGNTQSNFTDYTNVDRRVAIALFIYGLIFKIIVIIIIMTIGKMIWNNVLTVMIPSLGQTTAFGIFALWFFIGLMSL